MLITLTITLGAFTSGALTWCAVHFVSGLTDEPDFAKELMLVIVALNSVISIFIGTIINLHMWLLFLFFAEALGAPILTACLITAVILLRVASENRAKIIKAIFRLDLGALSSKLSSYGTRLHERFFPG